MPTREAFRNFIFTLVALFIMGIVGMLLKARYRLPSELAPIKAIPVAQPVETPVNEPRAYKSGEFWVLPHPELIVSRGNEADTLRVRSGTKEDVFVLYFVDALEATWDHPKRINEQAAFFGQNTTQKIVDAGVSALAYVTQLLTRRPFKVYTKWGRVPECERFYGMVSVEMESGQLVDLGELLVQKGYAIPNGQTTPTLPSEMKDAATHHKDLQKAMLKAKADRLGLWNPSR